ncbi:hypothetical protein RRG08_021339 [Elysia crispata]|uniref:Uncharacterized protein n=1 Tax=Elysia crispata TaxID=231223 RepID=A0AAE1AZ53_9GAST|nr:hypothetical protein RRG08_021339 [Elysia crispata]
MIESNKIGWGGEYGKMDGSSDSHRRFCRSSSSNITRVITSAALLLPVTGQAQGTDSNSYQYQRAKTPHNKGSKSALLVLSSIMGE